MKKKVIGLLIVLAVLIGAVGYSYWVSIPVMDVFPEADRWGYATYAKVTGGGRIPPNVYPENSPHFEQWFYIGAEDVESTRIGFSLEQKLEIDAELIHEALKGQRFVYADGELFVPEYLFVVKFGGQTRWLGISEGETLVLFSHGQDRIRRYTDDGSIYRTLVKLIEKYEKTAG